MNGMLTASGKATVLTRGAGFADVILAFFFLRTETRSLGLWVKGTSQGLALTPLGSCDQTPG